MFMDEIFLLYNGPIALPLKYDQLLTFKGHLFVNVKSKIWHIEV